MNKKVRKLFVSLLALLLTMGFFTEPVSALADSPYKTYTVDGYGSVIETQTAYLPYGTLNKFGDETVKTKLDEAIKEIYEELENDWCSGITLSGGDPLFVKNRKNVKIIR